MIGPETTPLAEALNRACACFAVSRERLLAALAKGDPASIGRRALTDAHAHLVASNPVFLASADAAAIAAFARDLQAVLALPGYQAAALAQAGPVAAHDPGIPGGLLGLDFHLTPAGPQLIEINTNPGGILINAEIADALRACCDSATDWLPALPQAASVRAAVASVFSAEWRMAGGRGTPHIAIVDEHPEQQYLYPEFCLFQDLFEDLGWHASIVDPSALRWHAGRLWTNGRALDFVYNRLTDFALSAPAQAPLRAAYLADAVVVSPHPRAHALHADKRRLVWLSDAERLQELGADRALAQRFAARVPETQHVDPGKASYWWSQRRDFFFKSARGFGSKGAYDGAKLTRGVFETTILRGDYLAQRRVPPAERGGREPRLKYDLRAYVWQGQVLLHAARLYRGQTTNFRTAGGGFAPVVIVPAAASLPCPTG